MAREIKIIEYGIIDSTNLQARRLIEGASGAEIQPTVLLADGQTAGRGRLGRSFYSPTDTGLYASLILESPSSLDKLLSLTALAAVAASEAIEAAFGINVGIKWVNDLYYNERKIAGILAESCISGTKRYIILGIGINLSTESFPDDILLKAGSLGVTKVTAKEKRELATDLFARLLDLLDCDDTSGAMNIYRARSTVIGKRVSFLQNGTENTATALGVTDLGALTVRLDSGETLELSSGEISIFVQKEQL
ncbi:MAG: biotin--[Clostridia bacterium]|nr:biotin--[acetyl-CoA-carboxylase] ligase [Clostridia bacterium]